MAASTGSAPGANGAARPALAFKLRLGRPGPRRRFQVAIVRFSRPVELEAAPGSVAGGDFLSFPVTVPGRAFALTVTVSVRHVAWWKLQHGEAPPRRPRCQAPPVSAGCQGKVPWPAAAHRVTAVPLADPGGDSEHASPLSESRRRTAGCTRTPPLAFARQRPGQAHAAALANTGMTARTP